MWRRFARRLVPAWLALAVVVMALPAALAQYPGQINTKKKEPTLRSIAVVEWEGEAGKPSASRIIPIAIYDGQNYQPGGLYLARPAPLALLSGTEYILESAGRHRGFYDVDSAADVQGYWIGYGRWKPLAAPKSSETAKSKPQPGGLDPGRPHYDNAGSSQAPQPAKPATKASTSAPVTTAQNQQPPASVPGRPVLRHRSAAEANTGGSFLPPGPETDTASLDPGRPVMSFGRKNPTNPDFKLSKLTGSPAKLHQMVAVSDAANRKPQSFVYSWANPADAGKMKAALEKLAVRYLAETAPKPELPAVNHRRHTIESRRRIRPKAPLQPSIELTNEQFDAYGLSYSGGATLVFTAQTDGAAGKVRYITLIAHPDFYGVPQVLFKSITSNDDLDQTPKMKLIDAVDTEGDGRGDLIFELTSRNSRQFAIYQVAGGEVQQLFTTGPLAID